MINEIYVSTIKIYNLCYNDFKKKYFKTQIRLCYVRCGMNSDDFFVDF